MNVLLYNLVTAAVLVLAFKAAERLTPRRRFPVLAIVLTGLVIGGLILQATWHGAMDALDSDPSRGGWWRPLTSVIMQNGGVVGDLWNVATIAVIAAYAEWYWGRLAAAGLFLAAALVPRWLDLLVGDAQVSTEPRNWAGSSGMTYLVAATLAGALAVRALRTRRVRDGLLAVAAPLVGLATWLAQDNAHGLMIVEGFVAGAVLAALVTERSRRASPAPAAAEPDAVPAAGGPAASGPAAVQAVGRSAASGPAAV
ncbi:hypothetical protein GCM10010168_92530 [Actinoplanes ianthinogenes]|uniref:Rhomboid family intramembrane serine protease n=1 Tax=Actinoplanes ianthinogenes TaxID=122358 RepID=A0ABM7LJZ0_9ACTN|nr:hypothetical protein [Actinoplanes ianthinogenes]BCJ39568.1 hypothetical protein Aiant_02250 [Actinoplanes ianthinogenes]GGR59055.1 hypothetical protein GCM10010168_92530 [Actinoplanes ianthinogenes]